MYKNKKYKLKEQPQLYKQYPVLTIGKEYLVKDIDGSNFIIDDDNGDEISIGSCRFQL